jgi:hypothetical protein
MNIGLIGNEIAVRAHHLEDFFNFLEGGAYKPLHILRVGYGPRTENLEKYGLEFITFAADVWEHLAANPDKVLAITDNLDILCHSCRYAENPDCKWSPYFAGYDAGIAARYRLKVGHKYTVAQVLNNFKLIIQEKKQGRKKITS